MRVSMPSETGCTPVMPSIPSATSGSSGSIPSDRFNRYNPPHRRQWCESLPTHLRQVVSAYCLSALVSIGSSPGDPSNHCNACELDEWLPSSQVTHQVSADGFGRCGELGSKCGKGRA